MKGWGFGKGKKGSKTDGGSSSSSAAANTAKWGNGASSSAAGQSGAGSSSSGILKKPAPSLDADRNALFSKDRSLLLGNKGVADRPHVAWPTSVVRIVFIPPLILGLISKFRIPAFYEWYNAYRSFVATPN